VVGEDGMTAPADTSEVTAANPNAAIAATWRAIHGLLDGRDFTLRVVTRSATTVRLYVEATDRPLTAREALRLLDRLSCTGQHSPTLTDYTDAAGVTRLWGLRVVHYAAVYVGVVHT
jgi:hypothetical protein